MQSKMLQKPQYRSDNNVRFGDLIETWCRMFLAHLSFVCKVTFQIFSLTVMPLITGCGQNINYC